MTTDPLGRADAHSLDHYCSATNPTLQLTQRLAHDLLVLVANRERCEIRLQVGNAPAFTRIAERS